MLQISENFSNSLTVEQDFGPSALAPESLNKESLAKIIEYRMVEAVWTLRRLPDGEEKWLCARNSLWPESADECDEVLPVPVSDMKKRYRIRPTPGQIDQMQPTLDLLTLLPDLEDRKLLFWAAWHQQGEVQTRIPWMKVRRSLDKNLSRWTLRRRYSDAFNWLAAVILL